MPTSAETLVLVTAPAFVLSAEHPWPGEARREPDTRRAAVSDRRRQGGRLPAGSLARDTAAGRAGDGTPPGVDHDRDRRLPEDGRGAEVARRRVRLGRARVPLGVRRAVPGPRRQPAPDTRGPLVAQSGNGLAPRSRLALLRLSTSGSAGAPQLLLLRSA